MYLSSLNVFLSSIVNRWPGLFVASCHKGNFVTGPEAKVVFKTLLILVCNFIKPKPIEEILFSILEEQEKEVKSFEMEMDRSL